MTPANINPRNALHQVALKYPFDQRGYYYLSELTRTLEYIINKWQELENENIQDLNSIKLNLDDFVNCELEELLAASDNMKREKYKIAENSFEGLKNSLLKLYDSYYK